MTTRILDQPTGLPDAELARAAQQGDKRAFVEIVARHQAMVCGIALGILGDFAASEDAAQEAFLTAWRKFQDLREPDRLRPWLAQIARHTALGHRRRTREHDPLEQAARLASDAPAPDEAAASEEEAALVRASLAQLPETYREPLVLFYREGQSVRAVAEALGLSEDAVKQRLARGRELLRERLTGLVETVLTRTGPTAMFTATIAVAIGALTAPAAMAGSVFAATSASGASATASTTSLLTAMTTSKGFLAMAALVAMVCVPVGYQLSTGSEMRPRATRPAGPNGTVVSPATTSAPSFENSTLFAEWRELHERHGTNAQAMPVLYQAIGDLKDPFRRRAFRAALIAEWVQVDPAGGLEFVLGKGRDETQRRQFLEEWLARDARSAVETLLAHGPGWEEMARECLPEIARRLPSRLAEVASRLPTAESYWDTHVRDAFGILAQADLTRARQAAEGVTGPSRDQALAGIAHVWAGNNLEEAMAWARKLPEGTDRDEVLRVALLGKAAVDPVAALELAGLVPSGGRHAHASSTTGARVLIEAAKTDFDGTVAWLVAHPARFGREDLMGLSSAVTDRLNTDAAGFLRGRAEDGSLAALLPAIESALLNRASGQSPAVWQWLKSQVDNETTLTLKQKVLSFAGYQNPEVALRLAADVPRTAAGDAQVKELARSLVSGNRLDRFDGLMAQAPDRLRLPLVEAAFQNLRTEQFENPQRWIDRLALLPEASRGKGIESIARAWAQQNPEDAIAWAAALAPGESRHGGLAAIASAWAMKDARGAANWVAAMPPGTERDRSAASWVLAVGEQYPQEAWNWAIRIDDPAERVRAATHAAKLLAARDATTARQWIESGPFTPEMKAQLQSALEPTGRSQVPR